MTIFTKLTNIFMLYSDTPTFAVSLVIFKKYLFHHHIFVGLYNAKSQK